MVDTLTPRARSERMARIRGKNTKPEMVVRRLLHRMGYRFRLHAKELPGRPDIIFRRRRKVVFVHGCFWHKHPSSDCKLARMPKSKLEFWGPKLDANRERDIRNEGLLREAGWQFLVVWECELRDMEQLENKLRDFMSEGSCA